MPMQQFLFEKGVKVVPGSQTFGPGANNFTVPLFNTLTISLSGGGGGGGTASSCLGFGIYVAGTDGVDTVLSALGLTAHGGKGASPGNSAMTGGTASGGSTNTTGGTSTVGFNSGSSRFSGAGGAGGSGAAGGLSNGVIHSTSVNRSAGGSSGATGGGGGGGAVLNDVDDNTAQAAGGSGAGYCSRAYTAVGGVVKYNDVLSFTVGAGATAWIASCTASWAGGGTVQILLAGGAGGAGQITFTWS
jgi:hypothetical protein